MTKKRPVIGIPGSKNYDNDFFGGGLNHLDFIDYFGNARIIMPWEEKVDVDLLYLPGGLDLSPATYGQVPSFKTSNHDVMKEFFYHNRLKNYVDDTPIFGVCLGMQMLGVYFKSQMTQNLLCHEDSPDRWETAHDVTIIDDVEEWDLAVNSHHHQCIMKSQLSKALIMLAYSECDEPTAKKSEVIVEAFKHKSLPIVGVQWHPEELWDDFSIPIMKTLLAK